MNNHEKVAVIGKSTPLWMCERVVLRDMEDRREDLFKLVNKEAFDYIQEYLENAYVTHDCMNA